LWSVTATQSISAAMYLSSQACGVNSFGLPMAACHALVSLEAGVWVWKSNFHQRAPG
jgi:hypothetical protein